MKGRVAKFAALLLLGAIVNVVVAWGCAAWSRLTIMTTFAGELHSTDLTGRIYPPDWHEIISAKGFGMERLCDGGWASHEGVIVANGIPRSLIMRGPNPNLSIEATPRWSRLGERHFGVRGSQRTVIEQISGWPIRSLWCGAAEIGDTPGPQPYLRTSRVVYRGLNLTPEIAGFNAGDGRVLPLSPIWPGFAINTVFYAAIVWMLSAFPGVPRKLRRRMRAHHGCCIACGYDLRGRGQAAESNVCPECGGQAI